MKKKQITEKSGEHKAWNAEAKRQTLATLPEFLRHLTEDYGHDYGTICHAISAGMIATMSAIDKSPQGGITGFQASCIGWAMINELFMGADGPKRLVTYENMLYPQYADEFAATISKDTAAHLRKKAKSLIAKNAAEANPAVVAHWKKVAAGVIPFGYSVEP